MKQFFRILKFELGNYFKNKVFIATTLFLVIAVAGVLFFPLVKDTFFKSDKKDAPEKNMAIVCQNEAFEDSIKGAFTPAFKDYKLSTSKKSEKEIKDAVLSEEIDCAFIINEDLTFKYFVKNRSLYDSNAEIASEILKEVYRTGALLGSGLKIEDINAIMSTQIKYETVNLGKDQSQNFFYTYIMIFALYTIILLYGQLVATSVATEKSSRAMELLITSAKPTSMMFGKVLAACIAGLTQIVAIFGSSILFYGMNKKYWNGNPIIESMFDMPPQLFLYMLLFCVLGFLVYAFLFGAIASTVSRLEDINTAITPLSFIFVLAFMIVIFSMSSGNIDNIAMKICSFVPFTSPMAMFTRLAMSTVPIYEIIISVLLLIGSVIGFGVLSAKIYKVGVLLYGTPPKLHSVLKAVFKK